MGVQAARRVRGESDVQADLPPPPATAATSGVKVTTTDSKMVRLPSELIARIDEARGEIPRPAFLEALLDGRALPEPAYAGTGARVSRTTSGTAERRGRLGVTETTTRVSSCSHPVTRRIGDGCGACGATGLGGRR